MNRKQLANFLFLIIISLIFSSAFASTVSAQETIRVGLILPLSGPRKASGLSTKAGAELLKEELNAQGGILIGKQRYQLEFVYADNETNLVPAVKGALRLISNDMVLGIVGPNASSRAIPVGAIAQAYKIPMVSPTSTNPKTTKSRPFVFRACFLDDYQGEAMARFSINEFKAKKAAVIFDAESAYPEALAASYKDSFERESGQNTVVAYESFKTDYSNLESQLKRVMESNADILFLPQYSNELPSIMKQIRTAGWDKPVIGGDAWASSDLVEICGDLCKGLFFSAHFGPLGAEGKAKEFVDKYRQRYGTLPSNHSALGYDAASLLIQAISKIDKIERNIFVTREKVRVEFSKIADFQGVSGLFNMDSSGNPSKSAVIIRIDEDGNFKSYTTVKPSNS